MNRLNSQDRLSDLLFGFSFGDQNAQARPTPHEFTIGTSNPALAELKRRRGQLTTRQDQLVDRLDRFYEESEFPRANAELGFSPERARTSTELQSQRATLQRRASFLLNFEAMHSLEDPASEIEARPDLHTSSNAKLEVNAILNSAKTHTERVMAAALQEARDGDRICPLVLQPQRFPVFLEVNRFHIRNILDACRLQQPARDRALKPALEDLASAYFAYSCNYDGAPAARAQNVEVELNKPGNVEISSDRNGNITAKVSIDSADAETFCRALRVNDNPTADGRALLNTHMLKGFENLPIEKKLAGFYTQGLFRRLAQVQEVIGVQKLNVSQHGHAAQQIAARTEEEWYYRGNSSFRDAIFPSGEQISEREQATYGVAMLRELDNRCVAETGTPLITMPEVRSWTKSTAMPIDLRALREPMSRLLLQAPPLTGRALLDLPEFRN